MKKYIEIQKEVLNDYDIKTPLILKNSLEYTINIFNLVGNYLYNNKEDSTEFTKELCIKYDLDYYITTI